MKQEMLINAAQPEECRIAIVEDGVLQELYVERADQEQFVGNIYKGVIVNLEPSIQAAFVDFGAGRNGFLHVSDVEPQYFRQAGYDPSELGELPPPASGVLNGVGEPGEERPRNHRSRPFRPGNRPRFKPPIQNIFKRGDEVIVQVIKEGIGNKGPTLSTYISIPGRYLVLMPALGRVGVSRKIEDESVRRRLRDIMRELNVPKGLGFIVRTAGADRTRRDLSRDLAYLMRLWKVLVRRIRKLGAPVDIYEESDIITRTIRDIFSTEVGTIIIDEPKTYEKAKEFLEMVMPRYVNRLQLYDGKEPLFHKFNLEDEISIIHQRRVPLKPGGSIVIDQTEALVAIDVNSGNFRAEDSAEETAYQINLIAAKEIARQIRLRDLGGVIVNDFIDMRKEKHRRAVERALREAVQRDRARTKIIRTSPFGLIEMTRQRIRPSLKRTLFRDCPLCHGAGLVKTVDTMAIDAMRQLILACLVLRTAEVAVTVANQVAEHLNNNKRRELSELERQHQVTIRVMGAEHVSPEHLVIECRDADGHLLPAAS